MFEKFNIMKLWNNIQLFNELSKEFSILIWKDIPCIVLVDEYFRDEETCELNEIPLSRLFILEHLSDLEQQLPFLIVRQIKAVVFLKNKIDECVLPNPTKEEFENFGNAIGIYIDENVHKSIFRDISNKYDYFRASWFYSYYS